MRQISIYRDNVWAGEGIIGDDGEIRDCAAILGDDQDASDETYEAIQDAIESGDDEVVRSDGVYTWMIESEPAGPPQPTWQEVEALGRRLGAEIARFTLAEETCTLRWVGLEAQDVDQIPDHWGAVAVVDAARVAKAEYDRVIAAAIAAGKVSREEREEISRRAGNVDG